MKLNLQRQINLAGLTTMALPALAEYFCVLESPEQIPVALEFAESNQLAVHILSGGSNSLFAEQINGLVLYIAFKGIELAQDNEEQVLLKVAAGEIWDEFLQYCLQQKYYGLENLAIIPGKVGAAPIQNIGAYGVEVASHIKTVHVYDRQLKQFVQLDNQACRFAYRDSIFKQNPGRYIITHVEFMLNKQFVPNLSYQALADRINTESPQPEQLRQAVIAQRNSRLPNPAELANAGSFFKNPIVSANELEGLQQRYPDMPYFKHGEQYKVPAAWLIEQCGWKGKSLGAVGMYEKQALVMVNHGGANFSDVKRLSETITKDVAQQFAIHLEPEPQFVEG